MTPDLLDTRFARSGYPKTVTHMQGCDDPEKWLAHWRSRGFTIGEEYKLATNKHVEYTLNSLGYRCPEFSDIDWNNSYVFLGCSHTFGTGIPESETFPKQIEKLTGVPCINLGVEGSSNLFTVFNSSRLVDVQPKRVFIQWTYSHRFGEFLKTEHGDYFAPQIPNDGPPVITEMFKHWLLNNENVEFWDQQLLAITNSIWKNVAPVVVYKSDPYADADVYTLKANNKESDIQYVSRDGAHYNGKYYYECAQEFVDYFNLVDNININSNPRIDQ